MTKKLFITTALTVLTTFCFSSCSSDDIITSCDENVIATAEVDFVDNEVDFVDNEVDFVDNSDVSDDITICNGVVSRYAHAADSATYYKKYGKYMSTEEKVLAETVPNAPSSRAEAFTVQSKKIGNVYKITIRSGSLSVEYETDYIYEFPQKYYDLKKEYLVNYRRGENEFIGYITVYRPNSYFLSVCVDVLTKIGDHSYDESTTGMSIRINQEKFQLTDRW